MKACSLRRTPPAVGAMPIRVPGAALRRTHAHAHQPAVPAVARTRGGGNALRAVAGALGGARLERGGHDRAHGRDHDPVRGLRRQPLGDLDRRRADGAHLVRHLRLRGGRDRAACRPRSGSATRSRSPRPPRGSRRWTSRSISRNPTRCGAGSSAACSWRWPTSAATRARCSATSPDAA